MVEMKKKEYKLLFRTWKDHWIVFSSSFPDYNEACDYGYKFTNDIRIFKEYKIIEVKYAKA